MYFDSGSWPPPPDGSDPEPPKAMSAAEERCLMILVGVLLLALFLGPFAGTSVIAAVVALIHLG